MDSVKSFTKTGEPASEDPIDYLAAGVNITAGNKAVERIRPHVESTFNASVLDGIGGFGSFFDLKSVLRCYEEPVLVQSMDGVGTKIKVARLAEDFRTIGIDLVSACCNDIVVHGARPLTFLDYIATENLDPMVIEEIIEGIAQACRGHGVALVGGELAEMPGTYLRGEHDLVGVITGVVEKRKIIDGKSITRDDVVLALPSNGLHTNGYSLARKLIFEEARLGLEDRPDSLSQSVAEALLAPHENYLKPIFALLEAGHSIKGMAHITGGGIIDNIPRILPAKRSVEIHRGSWPIPPLFALLQRIGHLPDDEMFRTFNMGLGLAMIVSPETELAIRDCMETGAEIFSVGKVVAGDGGVRIVDASVTG